MLISLEHHYSELSSLCLLQNRKLISLSINHFISDYFMQCKITVGIVPIIPNQILLKSLKLKT